MKAWQKLNIKPWLHNLKITYLMGFMEIFNYGSDFLIAIQMNMTWV